MREPPIGLIVEKIAAAFNPRRIIMFGSRARGDASPGSDLDLLVEMDSDKPPPRRASDILRLFGPRKWAMDVVVYTPEEVKRLRNVVGTLVYTVEREGKVLYERQ